MRQKPKKMPIFGEISEGPKNVALFKNILIRYKTVKKQTSTQCNRHRVKISASSKKKLSFATDS